MGLFSSKEPVFLKSDTAAERQLEEMRTLTERVAEEDRERLDRDIKLVETGIYGENQVAFELANCHLPLYVLHDLRLEHEGLSSQIDFLVITPYVNLVIECKNLFGDIEVNSKGDFARTVAYGKHRKKEGLYSPITQNERHLQLMKAIRSSEKGTIMRAAYNHWFADGNKAVVVLANPKTILNDRYAKKEVKSQIIRADSLIAYIKALNEAGKANGKRSDREMREAAEYWLSKHVEQSFDLAEKYHIAEAAAGNASATSNCPVEAVAESAHPNNTPSPACPRCGATMVLRTAKRGERAGKQFWGCSAYPKCRGIVNVSE